MTVMIVGIVLLVIAIILVVAAMAGFDTYGEALIPWIYFTGSLGSLAFISGALLLLAEAIAR